MGIGSHAYGGQEVLLHSVDPQEGEQTGKLMMLFSQNLKA